MSPILTMRTLLKHPLLKRSLGKPHLQTGVRAFAGVSRHVGWALGVTSKFRRAWPGQGLQSRTMIFSRGLMLRIVRLQTLLSHVPSGAPALHTAAPSLGHPFRASGLSDLSATMSRSAVLPPAGTPIIRMTAVPIARWGMSWAEQSSLPGNVYANRKRTADFVERIAAPRIARQISPGAAAADSPALSPSRVSARRPIQAGVSHVIESGLPERVIRKHRRIEERAFLRPRDVASTVASVAMIPEAVVAHRARARERTPGEIEMPFESGPRSVPHSPAPNVNVAQITEAVLQQLDRRLIAARERMGRI